MKSARLIVNADDFGMSRGITDAILLAHKEGIVTSTSMMANQLASEYAASTLSSVPALGVGVHLNLTAGRPVLPPREIPTLVDTGGNFHSPKSLFWKLSRFRVNSDEIEAEFRAQIRWLRTHGIEPIHADSHQHVHLYPAALLPFARAVAGEEIACVRAPRCTSWSPNRTFFGVYQGRFVRRAAVHAYRTAAQQAISRKFAMPHSRICLSAKAGMDAAVADRWIDVLNHLPSRDFELTCHPGFAEAGFSLTDRIARQRKEDLALLLDSRFRSAVARNGIRLIRYADLEPRGQAVPKLAKAAPSLSGDRP